MPQFSISGLAIRRHIGTLMLTLAVLVVGLYFATRLPVDLLPAITYPRIGIRLNTPGLAPEVAIQQITRPLEDALSTTDGVTQVVSRTREGSVSVDLFFPAGYNIEQALNDVLVALAEALQDLVKAHLIALEAGQIHLYSNFFDFSSHHIHAGHPRNHG